MRLAAWMVGLTLYGTGLFAQDAWLFREVAKDTNVWYALRASAESSADGLVFRHERDGNGLLLPHDVRQRQTMLVEADIRIRQRFGKDGWNFAGVALYQDDANYWMLSLVEGPDGRHSIDFIENHAGQWQAQNEVKTLLKREGNISFGWKSGVLYRLRLKLDKGLVHAQISDPADGRVLGAASYVLGETPAVRSGSPGLIVRDSEAECLAFRFGLCSQSGSRVRPHIALLDDALPGHDRTANARLAETLLKKGFGLTRLTAGQLLDPTVLNGDAFDLLILPQCASVPAQTGAAVTQYAREGGRLLFIGGPFLDNALWRVGGNWLDAAGREALLSHVEPAFRPFMIGVGLDVGAWRRSCSDKSAKTEFRLVSEGPQNKPCLRLDIASLHGWEVRHSPEYPKLFGEGDDFFTFLAKSGEKAAQLAVEIIERDGSRWIATADLTDEWRRVGLGVEAFRFWPDSENARKRGYTGDRMDPRQAVRVCFGMSSSHTPAMLGSSHTVWLADVGTARNPLAAAGLAVPDTRDSIEAVYPRYKVHTVTGVVSVAGLTLACSNVVCAIPRMQGEGFGRNGKWRFLPLAEALRAGGKTGGVCEWLLLNNRLPLEGVTFAGFGYGDPAVWSSPDVLLRIAEAAERMTRGALFIEAGTEQFAYWPGELVRLGARVRLFGDTGADADIVFEIKSGGRVVWSERIKRTLETGTLACAFVWQPPAEPRDYTFHARLEGAGNADTISHGFAVLDPVSAPKGAFITVRDGGFRLDGKPWFPVGVNFWPLYVSGMDSPDYSAGWLRDAYYAPRLVERDLEHLADMGVNMVSIQTPPLVEYRNLLDFLHRCATHNIRANLYVGQASPLAFNEKELKAFLETARLPGNATFFAYDTIWEPGNHVFKDDAARGKWDREWRAWIGERYGSIENAEKDWGFKARRGQDGQVISPPDKYFREDGAWRGMMAAYRRFMDNLTSRLWGKAHRRLKELDPNHLVSFRQGNTLPHDFALSGPVKHIDFICPEGYAIYDTDEGEDAIGFITRYVDFTTHGKPIVWSEFGQSVWDNGRMAPNPVAVEKQGRYSERFYRTSLAAGADGTVPWWWVGGYRIGERSDYGIIEPDRTERPAARLIREYGPRLKTPRGKLQPAVWFKFDRDAHAGGYWRSAFNEGAAAYRAAKKDGKALGVRTEGMGTDSMTVPLIAVGNVPCNGSNPPKYLDAEFNVLQVFNAESVWQEAEDGEEIVVAADQPVRVRASAGNTQEATWLAGKGEGCVALVARVAGKESGRWPIKDPVPYLGDAAFGEFTLLPSVTQSVNMTVRLEAFGRTPFGEERVFRLKAKGR